MGTLCSGRYSLLRWTCFGSHTYLPPLQTAQRWPLFDQLIVNLYQPGEGLKPHVDLLRFQDGIAIVSLQSSAILAFTRGKEMVDVQLDPGDLLLLEGESRCARACCSLFI